MLNQEGKQNAEPKEGDEKNGELWKSRNSVIEGVGEQKNEHSRQGGSVLRWG